MLGDGGSAIAGGLGMTTGGGETSSIATQELWEEETSMELVHGGSYKKGIMYMRQDLDTCCV